MARPLIIGAGVNGLVTAFYLARAGLKPLVLERRARPGGCLVSDPDGLGRSIPTLSHAAGPLLPEIVEDARLSATLLPAGPQTQRTVLGDDGSALVVEDSRLTAVNGTIAPGDATRFVDFVETCRSMAAALRPLLLAPPPSVASPAFRDLVRLLATGHRVRSLGRRKAFGLLQWGPMPIADLAEDWFASDLVRAAVAARGIFGRAAGPKSAGTTLELLLQAALTGHVVASSPAVKGGPGAVTAALAGAATRHGAEIRPSSEVRAIDVADGRVRGVRLDSGEELPADLVVSSADPARTFLQWVDAAWLGPDFVSEIRHFRCAGVVAKVNLVLSDLPRFSAFAGQDEARQQALLAGRLQIGASPRSLERAFDASKYGRPSDEPVLDLAVPTVADASLGDGTHHVVSVYAQYAPRTLRGTSWDGERDSLGDRVVRIIDRHAPGFERAVVARQVLTPLDLERDYALSGGHIHHGEHAIEQLLLLRPVYGWASYRTPIAGLYLCGAGTHPSGGATGVNGYAASRAILADAGR
jgi:phytoene dehydrogenase-like protein